MELLGRIVGGVLTPIKYYGSKSGGFTYTLPLP